MIAKNMTIVILLILVISMGSAFNLRQSTLRTQFFMISGLHNLDDAYNKFQRSGEFLISSVALNYGTEYGLNNSRHEKCGKSLISIAKHLECAFNYLEQENWEDATLDGFCYMSESLEAAHKNFQLQSDSLIRAGSLFQKASETTGCVNMAGGIAGPSIQEAGSEMIEYARLFESYVSQIQSLEVVPSIADPMREDGGMNSVREDLLAASDLFLSGSDSLRLFGKAFHLGDDSNC
mmetsp:Transcript_11829/g.11893  ORF Transcript_11829/g.11893 Transcript_11829/m.11893 type:complete len:235 (-) Transcript_11829:93-797(-)